MKEYLTICSSCSTKCFFLNLYKIRSLLNKASCVQIPFIRASVSLKIHSKKWYFDIFEAKSMPNTNFLGSSYAECCSNNWSIYHIQNLWKKPKTKWIWIHDSENKATKAAILLIIKPHKAIYVYTKPYKATHGNSIP